MTSLAPQTAIDERPIEHDELEAALERRERLRVAKSKATKSFREADEEAKGMLAEFQLEDGEVARCGRFRIERKAVLERHVEFDTERSSRLRIVPVPVEVEKTSE